MPVALIQYGCLSHNCCTSKFGDRFRLNFKKLCISWHLRLIGWILMSQFCLCNYWGENQTWQCMTWITFLILWMLYAAFFFTSKWICLWSWIYCVSWFWLVAYTVHNTTIHRHEADFVRIWDMRPVLACPDNFTDYHEPTCACQLCLDRWLLF